MKLNYKKMYFDLFSELDNITEELINIQKDFEQKYIESENEEKIIYLNVGLSVN